MRKGLALGLVGVLLAGAGVGYWVAHEPSRPSAGGVRGSATRKAGQPFWDSWGVHKGRPSPAKAPFHFYDPLKDPPPYATPTELARWRGHLEDELQDEILHPDLEGPPLVQEYRKLAGQANAGNIQAATTLFEGLAYCEDLVPKSFSGHLGRAAVRQLLTRMRATHTDPKGRPTSHLAQVVRRAQRSARYCRGTATLGIFKASHPPEDPDPPIIDHLARIAYTSDNPKTTFAVYQYAYGVFDKYVNATLKKLPVGKRTPFLRSFLRQGAKTGAQAGVPDAWGFLYSYYRLGMTHLPVSPTHAFASLYTEYLLTRSRALAYQIGQLSQGVYNSEEIRQGMALAHRYYRELREGRRPKIPFSRKELEK